MISAILLAAGKSERMNNENKLLKKINDISLVSHSIKNILASSIDELIIVLGFQKEKIENVIEKNKKIKIVINEKYENGMSSSIITGLNNLSKNTVALKSQMEESRKNIGELNNTTSNLRQILSSSQARGQWGERMVEDILSFIGLSEGLNYKQQQKAGKDRPDFTFFLPDEKSLNMDVKFPLDHYEKYIAADSESEKELEKKAFLKDVRNRVKEVAKRSYIDPENGTVDYMLLFIPNESIYSFLNQEDAKLIDFSLEKKIILCSPITLYAVLSLIRQAVSNFAMERKAGEMQVLVGLFRKQWQQFVGKVDSMGKSLSALSNHFEDLKGPRLRELEKPMERITELQLGNDSDDKRLDN